MMTPLPSFSSLTLFRLTRSRYASLSGIGAAKYRGRWNQTGEEAIYTSCEIACTVLELLAHTPKNRIPSDMALLRISIAGEWAVENHLLRDDFTGGCIAIMPTLPDAYRYFNTDSYSSERPFALVVPSVITPSWNVVLYPAHKGFWEHIRVESVEPFEFDPRLFPESAETEDG